MKDEIKQKILEDINDWQYLNELPNEYQGFTLKKIFQEDGDTFNIISYENEKEHRKITLYYHEETNEYKVKLKIGVLEFCLIEYIKSSLEEFEKTLKERLLDNLKRLIIFSDDKISSIVKDKDLLKWEYENDLPKEYQGFSLFIAPNQPVYAINGSYLILDYSDFVNESNFSIYYNIFRDEFFGESRIFNIPQISYDFDY